MHDGSLVCFRAGAPGYHWSINFHAPVVSVFDVVVPLPSPSSSAPTSPMMLEQPHPLLVKDLPLDFAVLQQEPAATFVGRIGDAPSDGQREGSMSGEGELFAMSRDHFPLVPFAQVAEAARATLERDEQEDDAAHAGGGGGGPPEPARGEPCRGVDCLIGRHKLRNPPLVSPIGLDATLDPAAAAEPLLLDGPSSSTAEPTVPTSSLPADDTPRPNRRSPHQPGSSTLLASLYKSGVVRPLRGLGEAGGASAGRLTMGVVLLVLAAWAWARLKQQRDGEGAAAAGGTAKVRIAGSNKRSKARRASTETEEDDELPGTPPDGDGRGPAVVSRSVAAVKKQRQAGTSNGPRKRSPSTPPTPTGLAYTASSGAATAGSTGRGRASSVSSSSALSSSLTLSKDLPPLPPSALDEPAFLGAPVTLDDGDSSPEIALHSSSSPLLASGTITTLDDGADSDGAGGNGLGTPQRKRNRRRRGAKKKKAKEGAAGVTGLGLDELGAPGSGDKELLEGITLSERETRDDDSGSAGAGAGPPADAEGRGVDGEVVGASAPKSTATLDPPSDAVVRSAPLDPQVVGGLAVSETILGAPSLSSCCYVALTDRL